MWETIDYLREGTPRQRTAWEAITSCGVLEVLSIFDATLVSTICLDIDIPSSDLDVICCVPDVDFFLRVARHAFGDRPAYRERSSEVAPQSIVIEFEVDPFVIEIYGDERPVEEQQAYRHLSVMKRLLESGSSRLRVDVRALKASGIKSEAAFAQCLGLPGDPFDALLALEDASSEHITALLDARGYGLDTELQ